MRDPQDTPAIYPIVIAAVIVAIVVWVTWHDRDDCQKAGGQPITDRWNGTVCLPKFAAPPSGASVPQSR